MRGKRCNHICALINNGVENFIGTLHQPFCCVKTSRIANFPFAEEVYVETHVVTFKPIGTIRSGFLEEAGTPIQGVSHPDSLGKVHVLPEYQAGLQDLEGFSHIYLIYFLHRSQGHRLTCTPFMDVVERGVFATRAPCRPNPIGLSVVRLHKIEEAVLTVSEVDIVDGTPLLDIKPYVPHIDVRDDVKVGWMESALKINKHSRKADGRFVGPGRGKQK